MSALATIDGLTMTPFRNDELVVILKPDHPLAKENTLPFSRIVDLPLVGLHANSALHNLLARAAAEEGKPLNFLIRVTSFDAVCAMVSAGLGISIIPKAAASPYTTQLRMRALPLTDEWAKRQLFICHHRTVFSEGVGWKAHVPMLLGTGRKMRPVQRLDFSTGEAKKKIFREARSVALGLLI